MDPGIRYRYYQSWLFPYDNRKLLDIRWPLPLCFFFFSGPRLKCIDPSPSNRPAMYALSVSGIISNAAAFRARTNGSAKGSNTQGRF